MGSTASLTLDIVVYSAILIQMIDTPAMTREQLDSLAEQIANLSLRIDIAKHALLTHLRDFDAQNGWAGSGFISMPAWLGWRIGISPSAAREYVRVARALGDFLHIDAAFAAGKLSYSKVRALTRAAKPETEQGLLDIATHATAAQIETTCAAYRRARIDPSELPADLRRFIRRSNTASGMVRIELQLPPEQANVIWAAMNDALDAGRSEAASAEAPAEVGTPAALDDSAEARLIDPAERADAMVSVAQSFLEHPRRTLGSGYELVMMTSPSQLEQGPGGVGGFLRDGTPVPLHLARMLACDCARVDVQAGESGEVLDVGRSRRTIPSAIGRALWIRDGGCRVPGCGRKHHVHAHHIEAWASGGPTKLSNLALLCPSHHMLVHEGQLHIDVREGKLEFRNAHGLALQPVPERGEDLESIARWLNAVEPELDGDNFPKWDGSHLDLDAVISWMVAAETKSAA
jgi:hypothetical protein